MSSSLDSTLRMVVTIEYSDEEILQTELSSDKGTNYNVDISMSPESSKKEDKSTGSSVKVIY